MAELMACGMVKCSEDVACAGGMVLVEGQNKGQAYKFRTDFYYTIAVSTKYVYPPPSIPEIVDKRRGHNLWCLLDLKSSFYNISIVEHA